MEYIYYREGDKDEYSNRLTKELEKGYSKRNLWLMLKFFEFQEKVSTMSTQLSWSHYVELLNIIVLYYFFIVITNILYIKYLLLYNYFKRFI